MYLSLLVFFANDSGQQSIQTLHNLPFSAHAFNFLPESGGFLLVAPAKVS